LDTLTHALSGALVARASAPGKSLPGALPRRIAAGFLAAAAPDLDFVIGYLGPLEYLAHHRGVTHSLILLPVWALLLSWLLAKLLREPGGWKALYGVVFLSLGVHIAGDVVTNFGTILFAPLSDWRAALGTTFIIDLWFTGIILAGLIGSVFWRTSRWPALVACALLVGYIGLQFVQKQRAIAFGERHAQAQGMAGASVTAHPRPVSPFNWTVFVSDDRMHHLAHINLNRREARMPHPDDGLIARLDQAYLPVAAAQWESRRRYGVEASAALVRDAWNSPALAVYRWFVAVPAFDGISQDSACIWFIDLRFRTPGMDRIPFRYGVCRERADAAWRFATP